MEVSKKLRRSPCDNQQRDAITLQFKILADLVFQVDSEISGLLLSLKSCLLHDPAARPKSLQAVVQAISTPEHGNSVSAEGSEIVDNNLASESGNGSISEGDNGSASDSDNDSGSDSDDGSTSESDNNNIDDRNVNIRNNSEDQSAGGDNSDANINSSNNNSAGDTNDDGKGGNKIQDFFNRYALEQKEKQRLMSIARSFLDGNEAKAAIEDFENYREHPRSFWNQFSENLETADDKESIKKLLSMLSSFDGFSDLARMLVSIAVNEKVDSMINSRHLLGGAIPKPGQTWRALALELSWGSRPTPSQREKIRAAQGYRSLPAGILVGMKKPLWSLWGRRLSPKGLEALRAYIMTLKSCQRYLDLSPVVKNVRKSLATQTGKRKRAEDPDEPMLSRKQSQQPNVPSVPSFHHMCSTFEASPWHNSVSVPRGVSQPQSCAQPSQTHSPRHMPRSSQHSPLFGQEDMSESPGNGGVPEDHPTGHQEIDEASREAFGSLGALSMAPMHETGGTGVETPTGSGSRQQTSPPADTETLRVQNPAPPGVYRSLSETTFPLQSNSSNSEQTTSSEGSSFNNMRTNRFSEPTSDHTNMDSYSNANPAMRDATRAFPILNPNTCHQIHTNTIVPGASYQPPSLETNSSVPGTLYQPGSVYTSSTVPDNSYQPALFGTNSAVPGTLYQPGSVYTSSTVLDSPYQPALFGTNSAVPGTLYQPGSVYTSSTVLDSPYQPALFGTNSAVPGTPCPPVFFGTNPAVPDVPHQPGSFDTDFSVPYVSYRSRYNSSVLGSVAA